VLLIISTLWMGCEQQGRMSKGLALQKPLGETAGSVAEIFAPVRIPVEGFAIVGGLSGTGSGECPPRIREYLDKYILTQVPGEKTHVEKIIGSLNTAVVRLTGMMPTGEKDARFDVRVEALDGTQTTSLEGGRLYGAELKNLGTFRVTLKMLAHAEGPVYIDRLGAGDIDKRTGYVLGGGRVLDEYKITMVLRRPNYGTANTIRNRLNMRYGSDTAKAVSDSQIELKVPERYKGQRQRFVRLVSSTYLRQTPELTRDRIMKHVVLLATSEQKEQSEIILEAIGNAAIGKLSALLSSSSEEIRFRTGRCMLNIGSEEALDVLREIAFDETSPYRLESMEAIATAANYNDATAILRRLLKNDSFSVRFSAYEKLRALDDISITEDLIRDNLYLEQITQTEDKAIYVSRSGQNRIVLFGAPIYCRDDVFVQSLDGSITINAASGADKVSIIRKHPKRPGVIVKLTSSFELSDIIKTLAKEPVRKRDTDRIGLGVSYGEVIALLKMMSDKGAVPARFYAGQLPKIELNIKQRPLTGR